MFGYVGVLFSRYKYDLQGIENGCVPPNQVESAFSKKKGNGKWKPIK